MLLDESLSDITAAEASRVVGERSDRATSEMGPEDAGIMRDERSADARPEVPFMGE